MKSSRLLIILIFTILISNKLFPQTFEYISPKNNSILVSLKNNIILRSSENIDPASLNTKEFDIMGEKSGNHTGVVKLSDDNKTIIFLPSKQFSPDENVSVIVKKGIKTVNGNEFEQLTFHFKTTPLANPINSSKLFPTEDGNTNNTNLKSYHQTVQSIKGDSIPSDFPKISVDSVNNPAGGKIFLANNSHTKDNSIGSYLMILNNDGSPVKYKKLRKTGVLFKVEANGEISYNLQGDGTRIILDTTLTAIDTFQCGNGYRANGHDFELLPNGHALLIAGDAEPIDMSKIVPGGNPDAIVRGDIIQELDADRNVVFQWRTWDYLPITASYFDLTAKDVDLIHANAIDADADGNILFSLRHLSSIVKINRNTGNIMWILGGKENQFTFINEHEENAPTYFSYQHDIHVLPNGNITLFDNGNQHDPQYSRGVEYKLDEKNMTATLVWEYRHTPDIYAHAKGSVQRLPNGNTIICWGAAGGGGTPAFTEVHPDNSIAMELSFPSGHAYRAYKFPWVSQKPAASVIQYEVLEGNTYSFNSSTDSTGVTIKFTHLNAPPYSNAIVEKYNYAPVDPQFTKTAPILAAYYFKIINQGITSYTGEVHVNLNNYPSVKNPQNVVVYGREENSKVFTSVATSYDSSKNELVFNTSYFGDFAFGIPQTIDSAYSPILFSPKNNQFVNGEEPIQISWGTRGIASSYEIQINSDSTFNSTLLDSTDLKSSVINISSLTNKNAYYWRVRTTNAAGTSEWSKSNKFFAESPFIKILTPNGGENAVQDSTFIIRWQTNSADTVRIELLQGSSAALIADSVVSGTGAYLWNVSSNIAKGSDYKILISSISNSSFLDTSDSDFNVIKNITGVDNSKELVKNFELFQNYPNPFNPSTVIKYSIPKESRVKVEIFNTLGQKVSTLINSYQQAGYHQVNWNAKNQSSGIYFYSVTAVDNSGKNFHSVKKMILIK